MNILKEYMTKEKSSFDPVLFCTEKLQAFTAVGRNGAVSLPVKTVLDAGARPNLVQKKKTDSPWHFYICAVESPRLLDASKLILRPHGLAHLALLIREFAATLPFLVVQNLAAEWVLRTPFIDHRVKPVLCGLRKTVVFHSLFDTCTGKRPLSGQYDRLPLS